MIKKRMMNKGVINKGMISQRVTNKRMSLLNTHAGPMCSGEQETKPSESFELSIALQYFALICKKTVIDVYMVY